MTPTFEFRVLKGLHREAHCAVADGATVGADVSCDLVLADDGIAPHAAQIRLQPNGWMLIADDGEAGAAQTLIPWNRAVSLGEAWVTVAPEDAPWVFVEGREDLDAQDDMDRQSNAVASSAPNDRHQRAIIPPGLKRDSQQGWPTLMVLGAIAMVALALIGWVVVSGGDEPADDSGRSATSEQSLGQITATLERLGLGSSVHATLSKTGTVTVSGWVRDKQQYEAVASAMSQIWPMPALRVSLESEAILTARGILQRFSVKYDPLYQGNGRMDVVGIASDARERALALDAVREQLPGLTVLGNGIELAQDVGDALAKQLSSIGISGAKLTWQPGHLEVQPPELDAAQDAAFDKVMEAFNKRYWNVAQAGAVPEATVADRVPFQIRSVIGGPQPFIVLGDGTKLLVGGTYKRYQLIAVEDTRLIFDGPRRAIVTR
ncbi:type III secretion system inner membrane ring subunit SctD [Bordetella sp. 02P26C-1]|uniref:type III secretion system inner membrane ring subunit SctD n=1 Tax=Bordetella sp. 02P26C-1 TaxID=2683195 RepID=UPI001354CAB1|nr:type III secretion system inner membrane ring subunit SctD [Bordetella sp. 02P26C-1]MVW78567.1 EscD/YscD/HrpQ family type III secretion system inner membrane ring protein [Bordetella sp. 02P26C-1]